MHIRISILICNRLALISNMYGLETIRRLNEKASLENVKSIALSETGHLLTTAERDTGILKALATPGKDLQTRDRE